MLERYMETLQEVTAPHADRRVVTYFSAEFLTGPHLGNNLLCLGMQQAAEDALSGLGQNLNDLLEQEEEPGLGNGGLGRLAACYMDSLATLGVPAIGYGIRYEFGIFDQAIRDGWQVEMTDKWLRFGNPWEIVRPEITFEVKFGGHTEHVSDEQPHDHDSEPGGADHAAHSHEHAGGIEWEDDMVEVNRRTTAENMRWKLIDRDTGAANAAIDWKFRVGDQVKIRLVNEMDSDHPMPHPFHVHGAGRFLVLARDGVEEPNLVWKDTVLVRTGETVDILLDVTNPGRWMAHCHIAEHHESGMMFGFDVEP